MKNLDTRSMTTALSHKRLGGDYMVNIPDSMSNDVKEELERYVFFISKMDGVRQIYMFGFMPMACQQKIAILT